MTTIWNYRGDDRALWAVIAAIVGSYVLAMRLARWDATWQWVPLALPVAVLLIWFFLAEAGVRDLGFPAPRDRGSAAAGPLGGASALVIGAALGGAGAAVLPLLQGGQPELLGQAAVSRLGGPAVAAVLAAVAAAALEIVFRGALLRLAIARWSSGTAITVSVLLTVLGLLPVMLTRSAGTWSWLAASACAVAVLSLTLAWAAVRTRSLWMPLGWAAGLAGTGAAVLQGWPAQALGAWAAAGAAAAAGLLLIPAVLVLERVRPSGSERRAA